MKRFFVWGGALALLAGVFVKWVRPARMRDARFTAITPGSPPTASVVLSYGLGAMPARVILDLADQASNGGSATADGRQLFFEVPIAGAPSESYRITTTATYLLLGRQYSVVREFGGW